MESFKRLIPIDMLMSKQNRGAQVLSEMLSTHEEAVKSPLSPAQSPAPPKQGNKVFSMMLSNVDRRIGTANFKSKVGARQAWEDPDFLGLCSGPNPPLGTYQA